MDICKLQAKTINLLEEIESAIIKHMRDKNISVYSFINHENPPMIILDDENKSKDKILALHFDGYTLGVMLESDLTPLRSKFLNKGKIFPNDEITDKEIDKLSEESTDGSNGFSLLVDNTFYPLETLLDVARYIERLNTF